MNTVVIRAEADGPRIERSLYGHFAEHLGGCIYGGIWVGEDSAIPNTRGIRNDVVGALRRLGPPVLRWPGGCFADEYHWMDGIGPRADRPTMVNTHWGMVTETNHFGTHEFLDLCAQIGAAPYLCGNVGSGTVREMQQWVEYVTHGGSGPMADLRRRHGRAEPWALPYFGVGNENWGCGGTMRPEAYADLYRQYQTYVRDFGGNRVCKIACGPNGGDTHWTEVLMREAAHHMGGLALHYYTGPGGTAGATSRSATAFGKAEWVATLRNALRIESLIERHSEIMDRYDPARRVALVIDEWGSWYDSDPDAPPGYMLFQQNTLRDALVAGLTLNTFHRYAERVRMANIAQTVNVLQAMILTHGPQMLLTPTYHVFEMYRVHQGARALATRVRPEEYGAGGEHIPVLHASASRDAQGRVHLSLCNTHPTDTIRVECSMEGGTPTAASARVLTGDRPNAHNTFAAPDAVRPQPLETLALSPGGLEVALPPAAVAVVELVL